MMDNINNKPTSNPNNNSQGLHNLLHINGIQRSKSGSLASVKLKEQGDLIEVLPIQHCISANIKVEGSYTAQEPGNYILVFGKKNYSQFSFSFDFFKTIQEKGIELLANFIFCFCLF